MIRVFDEDPELGQALSPEQFEAARRYGIAEAREFGVGTHDPADVGRPDLLGLLILDGLMIRQVLVAQRKCGELVGPGSLVRPWDRFGEHAPMPFEVRWRVVEPVRLALLDQRMVNLAARLPPLMHAFVTRAVERSHTLALNIAIHCLQHVEMKLIVLFWHLADRFGKVTPDGTVIPLKLSHSDLAELISSRRPSVSARLGDLQRRNVLLRRADRTWMLIGNPPQEIIDMRSPPPDEE
jgi:CRP/FNR family transcriptional regulator, cyclic AMP receptor protein